VLRGSGDTVASGLDYTQPGDAIEDSGGTDLANISGPAVTENSKVDLGTPTLSSVTIGARGRTWTFVFNEAVSVGAGGSTGWAVTMSTAGGETLTYSSGSGSDTLV
jgi:hypothetical protein